MFTLARSVAAALEYAGDVDAAHAEDNVDEAFSRLGTTSNYKPVNKT